MQRANGLPFFCYAIFLLLPPCLDLYTNYFADSLCVYIYVSKSSFVSSVSLRFVASSGNGAMSLLAKQYENNYSWNSALSIFLKKINEASNFNRKAKFSMVCSGIAILLWPTKMASAHAELASFRLVEADRFCLIILGSRGICSATGSQSSMLNVLTSWIPPLPSECKGTDVKW